MASRDTSFVSYHSAKTPQVPQNILMMDDRYRIINTVVINRGTFGKLHIVEDKTNDDLIKTVREHKLIPDENIETAIRHASFILENSYSFIIQYLDLFYDKDQKVFSVVMENFDDSKTLETLFNEYKKERNILPKDQIQFWCIQMLKGIEFLHRYEIMHRNIKPSNIYIRDKNIVLGELGLERDSVVMTQQALEFGVGHLNYLAPEIIKNYINYTNKIDIWAFGCILYEMTLLKRLFEGRKAQIISDVVKFKELRLNFHYVVPLFLNVLKKSLAVRIDQRSSAGFLLELLSRNFDGIKQPIQVIRAIKPIRLLTKIAPIPVIQKTPTPLITSANLTVASKSSNHSINPSPSNSFIKIRSISQTNIQTQMKEADVLFKHSKFTEALKYYDQTIKSNPDHAEAYYKKACCLRGLTKYKESLEYFDTALKLDPLHLGSINYKAYSLKALSKPNEALKLFEQANRLNPDPYDLDSFFNKALSLYGLEKYLDAIEYYDEILEIDENNALAYNNKGILLKNLNNHELAIKCYDKAIELDPNYTYVFNNKGLSLASLKRFDEALSCFDQALHSDSKYTDALRNKGNIYFETKAYDQAIKCFDSIIDIDPTNSNSYIYKANSLTGLKRFKEAIETYNIVIKLEPNRLDAYNYCADIFKDLKIYKEALKCYDMIIKIDKNNIDAVTNRDTLLELIDKDE